MSTYPPKGTRAAIYARSAVLDDDVQPALDQIRRCQAFAESVGWQVACVFEDAGRSGTTAVGRAGFFAMMSAAERGEFDIVLAKDLARLSRNPADLHQLLANLSRLGVAAWTLDVGAVSDFKIGFQATLASTRQARRRRAPVHGVPAAVVKRIFEDYAAGVSVADICEALNAEGVFGPGADRSEVRP